MLAARRVRGDREVQNIGKRFCSCAWPARVLVNRGEHNSFIVRYQCLGAVAMIRVKVPDRRPRADRAIASHPADSLTVEQSAQSAPAVPDDRACHTRRSWGREKFARDLLARF